MIKNKTLSCLLFVIYKALKIALQFALSILHEQTTAKASNKLVG